jgi:hypothetical protein
MFLLGYFSITKWIDYDPLTEFERRRLIMARELKKLMDSNTQNSSTPHNS